MVWYFALQCWFIKLVTWRDKREIVAKALWENSKRSLKNDQQGWKVAQGKASWVLPPKLSRFCHSALCCRGWESFALPFALALKLVLTLRLGPWTESTFCSLLLLHPGLYRHICGWFGSLDKRQAGQSQVCAEKRKESFFRVKSKLIKSYMASTSERCIKLLCTF